MSGPWRWPAQGDLPFLESVGSDALAEVERIREEALALGWTLAQLLQNRGRLRFPSGRDWGLVCFLRGGRTIDKVTAEGIRIHSPTGATLTFYQPSSPSHPALRPARGK